MKKKYSKYFTKICKSILFILSLNIILAEGGFTTYFERTASYFKIQSGIINPFYKEIENLSLASEYQLSNYFSINPTNLLKKLKLETKTGLNDSTFVLYEQYDNNDIFIPSVMSVDFYIKNRKSP